MDSTFKKIHIHLFCLGENYLSVLRSISLKIALNGLNKAISVVSLAIRCHNSIKAHPLGEAFPRGWLLHETYSVIWRNHRNSTKSLHFSEIQNCAFPFPVIHKIRGVRYGARAVPTLCTTAESAASESTRFTLLLGRLRCPIRTATNTDFCPLARGCIWRGFFFRSHLLLLSHSTSELHII